mgnify:CR=1 FL=1
MNIFKINIINILFIITIVGTIAYLIYTSIKKNEPKKQYQQMNIPLTTLSQIWLKFNQNYIDLPKEQEEIEKTENIENQPSVEPAKTETKIEPVTINRDLTIVSTIKDFYGKYLFQYKKYFVEQKVENVLLELLNLLEQKGSCSSVLVNDNNKINNYYISVKDNLALIPLREHSLNTTQVMIEQINRTYSNFIDTYITKGTIAALAHDIGKIPEFQNSGLFNTKNHPDIAATWLESKLPDDYIGKRDILIAIKDHHTYTTELLSQLLRESDKIARQRELASVVKDYKIKSLNEWFDIKYFMNNYIEPIVNVTNRGYKNGLAFSFKGYIYIKPLALYDLAISYAKDLKIIDTDLLDRTDSNEALKKIANIFKKNNCFHPAITGDYPSRTFQIILSVQNTKFPKSKLMAIKSSLIDNQEEMEKRKNISQLFKNISEIIPI